MQKCTISLVAALSLLPISATAATAPPETQQTQPSTQTPAEKNQMEAELYLKHNKDKPGVTTLPSGLQYKILEKGEEKGTHPGPTDTVTVHYKGTLIDGTEFDSSYSRGTPTTFPVNGVIPGWTEALQLMSPGAKWLLTIPPNLAYGTRGAGQKIGPNTALIFEVELINVHSANKSATKNVLEDVDDDG